MVEGLSSEPMALADPVQSAIRRAQSATKSWVTEEEVKRYEAARRREQRLETLQSSNVVDVLTPEMIEALVDDKLKPTAALAWTRKWVAYQRGTSRPKGSKPILALMGDMGRGKTVAGAWLVLHEHAHYVEAAEVYRLASARWGADLEAWRRLQRVRVLVIDEFGTEPDAAIAAAAYRELLNRRQGERLTLILGNMSRVAFRDRLDLRTRDRIRERGQVVELAGPSLRQGEEL